MKENFEKIGVINGKEIYYDPMTEVIYCETVKVEYSKLLSAYKEVKDFQAQKVKVDAELTVSKFEDNIKIGCLVMTTNEFLTLKERIKSYE